MAIPLIVSITEIFVLVSSLFSVLLKRITHILVGGFGGRITLRSLVMIARFALTSTLKSEKPSFYTPHIKYDAKLTKKSASRIAILRPIPMSLLIAISKPILKLVKNIISVCSPLMLTRSSLVTTASSGFYF